MKWDELSEKERDELMAAMVMRWERPDGADYFVDDKGHTRTLHFSSFDEFMPSRYMDSAWEVVQKMMERDYWLSDFGVDKFYDGTIGYTARYYHPDPQSLGEFLGEVTCATGTEAICKAALKAMGVEIE